MATEAPTWPKRCACGLVWTALTWGDLTRRGEWHVETYHVELRHCTCGSTISMPLRLVTRP